MAVLDFNIKNEDFRVEWNLPSSRFLHKFVIKTNLENYPLWLIYSLRRYSFIHYRWYGD